VKFIKYLSAFILILKARSLNHRLTAGQVVTDRNASLLVSSELDNGCNGLVAC
jgi:hypothetical protein